MINFIQHNNAFGLGFKTMINGNDMVININIAIWTCIIKFEI